MAMPVREEPYDFLLRARELGVDVDRPRAVGGLAVDQAADAVTCEGVDVVLSPRQVELLALFLAAPRKVWTRSQLEWVCWGDRSGSRRVDVQLCRLRGRLGVGLFRNVRDRGWSLRAGA